MSEINEELRGYYQFTKRQEERPWFLDWTTDNRDEDNPMYVHCKLCVDELDDEDSPREFINIEIARIDGGMIFWCVRHERYVAHFELPDNVLPEDSQNGCNCCD